MIALALALHGMEEPPASLAVAVDRASCELRESAGGPAAYLDAALSAGNVVVRYRASLSGREVARLRSIARRFGGRPVTVVRAPTSAAAVEATAAGLRMECPRIDGRTEAALMLFVRSVPDVR